MENNVLDLMPGGGTINPIGIVVNGSGEQANEVYRNNLSSLDIGNLSNGRNRNVNNPNIGLQYLCNTNANQVKHDFAIPKELGSVGYGIRTNQGAAAKAAGNSFTAIFPGCDNELHIKNQQNNITYFCSGTSCPIKINTTKVFPASGFSNSCPSTLPFDQEGGSLTNTEKQQFKQAFDNTSNSTEVRGYAADMLLRHYLIDSTAIDFAAMRDLLTQRGNLESRFGVVDAWLQEKNATAAQQALTAIPTQFTLVDESLAEYNQFNSLKSLQINAIQNGISDAALVANNQSTLVQIAEAGEYYASAQAKALLNSVNGFTYTPPVILPSNEGLPIIAPPAGHAVNMIDEATIEAQPNPAKEQTVFRYHLPEGIEQGRITVNDLDGRTVAVFDIEDNFGSIDWDIKYLKEGVYLYSLTTDKTSIMTKRLVIVR